MEGIKGDMNTEKDESEGTDKGGYCTPGLSQVTQITHFFHDDQDHDALSPQGVQDTVAISRTKIQTRSKSKNDLKVNMVASKGEKSFACDVCGKTFSQNGNLVRHKRIHFGDKPFECDVCGKLFTSGGNLKVHCRIHTGQKPYECQVCGLSFTQSNQLKSHNQIHLCI